MVEAGEEEVGSEAAEEEVVLLVLTVEDQGI